LIVLSAAFHRGVIDAKLDRSSWESARSATESERSAGDPLEVEKAGVGKISAG